MKHSLIKTCRICWYYWDLRSILLTCIQHIWKYESPSSYLEVCSTQTFIREGLGRCIFKRKARISSRKAKHTYFWKYTMQELLVSVFKHTAFKVPQRLEWEGTVVKQAIEWIKRASGFRKVKHYFLIVSRWLSSIAQINMPALLHDPEVKGCFARFWVNSELHPVHCGSLFCISVSVSAKKTLRQQRSSTLWGKKMEK